MALPSSGPISLSQVNVELGFSATALITLNDAAVRNQAGVASGTISMQDLRPFAFTIDSNQTDANLRTLAVNAGWNEIAPAQATINSAVVISGSVQANSTAALTVNGSWPGGVTLTNNGTIVGRGGNGGNGGGPGSLNGGVGASGGRALDVSFALTLQNNGTIAGGGGGGGGGVAISAPGGVRGGGGGGGGRSSLTDSLGGTSPGPGGGSGGAGTFTAAGAGGPPGPLAANGGTGGDHGAGGAAGGDASRTGGAGGGAGQAISGNSNITYTATGTRLGPIV